VKWRTPSSTFAAWQRKERTMTVSGSKPNRLKIHAKVLYALAEFAQWRDLTVVMQDTVMRIHHRG
jgi:hypothetical protein